MKYGINHNKRSDYKSRTFSFMCFRTTKNEVKCKDQNRGIGQLPCKITYSYVTDVIPDTDAAIKYTDILINKGELLNPERANP